MVDEARGTADHDETVQRRLRQVLLDHLAADPAHALAPVLLHRLQVHAHVQLELARIRLGQPLEVLALDDVQVGLVGKDQRQPWRVMALCLAVAEQSQEGGNPRSARYQPDLFGALCKGDLVGLRENVQPTAARVFPQMPGRSLRVDAIPDFHVVKKLGHLAARHTLRRIVHVNLDDYLQPADFVVEVDRDVLAGDAQALGHRHQHHLAANRHAETVVGGGEVEDEAARVVGHRMLFGQGQGDDAVASLEGDRRAQRLSVLVVQTVGHKVFFLGASPAKTLEHVDSGSCESNGGDDVADEQLVRMVFDD